MLLVWERHIQKIVWQDRLLHNASSYGQCRSIWFFFSSVSASTNLVVFGTMIQCHFKCNKLATLGRTTGDIGCGRSGSLKAVVFLILMEHWPVYLGGSLLRWGRVGHRSRVSQRSKILAQLRIVGLDTAWPMSNSTGQPNWLQGINNSSFPYHGYTVTILSLSGWTIPPMPTDRKSVV